MNSVLPFNARRSMAMCSDGELIYCFGGVGKNYTESILDVSNDFYSYDIKNKTWKQLDESESIMPSSRRCIGFVSSENKIFLWGGSSICELDKRLTYNFLNDFWQYDLKNSVWSRIEPSDDNRISPLDNSKPSPRYTPIFEKIEDSFILFGGYTEDSLGKRKLNDIWKYKDNKWCLIEFPNKIEGYNFDANYPGIRYGCMSAVDANKLYICGGFSDDGDHIDVWEFDIKLEKWTLLSSDDSVESPEARYCAAFVFYKDKLILFGGRSRKNPKSNYNDLYEFDLKTKKWKQIQANTDFKTYDKNSTIPAYHAKSSVCLVNHYMYIMGGEGIHGHVSDFWRLNLEDYNWELISPARDDDPIFW